MKNKIKSGLPKNLNISIENRQKYNIERSIDRYPNIFRCAKCGYATSMLTCHKLKFPNLRYCKKCKTIINFDNNKLIMDLNELIK